MDRLLVIGVLAAVVTVALLVIALVTSRTDLTEARRDLTEARRTEISLRAEVELLSAACDRYRRHQAARLGGQTLSASAEAEITRFAARLAAEPTAAEPTRGDR